MWKYWSTVEDTVLSLCQILCIYYVYVHMPKSPPLFLVCQIHLIVIFCFPISPEWDPPSCGNNRVKFTYSCTNLHIHAQTHTNTSWYSLLFVDHVCRFSKRFSRNVRKKIRRYRAILSHMQNCLVDAILCRIHRSRKLIQIFVHRRTVIFFTNIS